MHPRRGEANLSRLLNPRHHIGMNRLAGKRVLITGASAGIGESCSRYFARQGSNLLLSARRLDRIDSLASSLTEDHGVDVHTVKLDVTDRDAVGAYVDTLVQEGLIPDVLVNNAGKAKGLDKLQDGDLDHWDEMIDTNVKGLLYVTRAILPHMIERDHGHVINIGSIAGRWVYPKGAVYNATKFAVRALSEAMNIDLLGTSIRVSSVDPGLAETEFSEVRFDGDSDRATSVYSDTVPLKADDVADAVIYVANAPPHVDIFNLVMMPTVQCYPGYMQRKSG